MARSTTARQTTRGRSTLLARLCVFALLLVAGQAHAVMDVGNLRNINLGNWTLGSGDAVASRTVCVRSEVGGAIVPWSASVQDRDNLSPTEFLLRHDSRTRTMPVEVRVIDVSTGDEQVMAPGVSTPRDRTGALRNCPGGQNVRVEVRIREADLQAGRTGRYRARLRLAGDNGDTDRDNFNVIIRLPTLVQVSDLDDIPLGTWTLGSGDLVGGDDVCVYTNHGNGRYNLTVTGQGAGGDYVLENGPDALDFDLAFDDGNGFRNLSPGVRIRPRNGDTTDFACGGGSSAAFRVTVPEANLTAAPQGSYAGTITVTVSAI